MCQQLCGVTARNMHTIASISKPRIGVVARKMYTLARISKHAHPTVPATTYAQHDLRTRDTLAEWLRRRPDKPMWSPRVASTPTSVASWLARPTPHPSDLGASPGAACCGLRPHPPFGRLTCFLFSRARHLRRPRLFSVATCVWVLFGGHPQTQAPQTSVSSPSSAE